MEKQTWQAIIEGNREVYAGWYTAYFKKLFNYGRKFTIDTELIEDAIQELFLDIWQRREKLLSIESPNSYIIASFRYILFKKIKQSGKQNAEPLFDSHAMLIVQDSTLNEHEHQELYRQLRNALDTLTPRQREAIYLRFYEKLSYEEVASVLNISVKATYKIMARALESLKDKMGLLLLIW
jgi:RNA polymerase sigma factor (sigma-70 family)